MVQSCPRHGYNGLLWRLDGRRGCGEAVESCLWHGLPTFRLGRSLCLWDQTQRGELSKQKFSHDSWWIFVWSHCCWFGQKQICGSIMWSKMLQHFWIKPGTCRGSRNDKNDQEQVGQFLRTVPRDSFTIATKYFPGRHGDTYDLASTLEAVEASLKRLGLDCTSASSQVLAGWRGKKEEIDLEGLGNRKWIFKILSTSSLNISFSCIYILILNWFWCCTRFYGQL